MSRQDDRLATISRHTKKTASSSSSSDPFFDFLSSAYKTAEKAVSQSTKLEDAYILGTKYVLDEHGKAQLEHHAQSMFRLTYRRDFPPLSPYNITSDAGWGCMIRAVQMMMAEAFRVHYLGKDWRIPLNNASSILATNEDYCKIIRMFLDYPGDPHFYSLHHLVQGGCAHDRLPGEWWGPSTAAHVLKDLARIHSSSYDGPLQVYVTISEVVYISEVEKLCANWSLNDCLLGLTMRGDDAEAEVQRATSRDGGEDEGRQSGESYASSSRGRADSRASRRGSRGAGVDVLRQVNHALNLRSSTRRGGASALAPQPAPQPPQSPQLEAFFDPLLRPPPSFTHPWTRALIIAIPLRLGVSGVNKEYWDGLAAVLRCRWSIGILGGRPNHAIYFTGVGGTTSGDSSARGLETLYGLDPHVVLPCAPYPQSAAATASGGTSSASPLLDLLLPQLHTPSFTTLAMSNLDPSLALGFYMRDRGDFEEFCNFVRSSGEKGVGSLISIQHTPPSYVFDDEDDDGAPLPTWAKSVLGKDNKPAKSAKTGDHESDDEWVLIR